MMILKRKRERHPTSVSALVAKRVELRVLHESVVELFALYTVKLKNSLRALRESISTLLGLHIVKLMRQRTPRAVIMMRLKF